MKAQLWELEPVSYTHLDVYKRQQQFQIHDILQNEIDVPHIAAENSLADTVVGNIIPVSYTHLDVYKRQLLLLRKRKGMEQVGEMLREHQNILHIMVHANQSHQLALFLNEIGGRCV